MSSRAILGYTLAACTCSLTLGTLAASCAHKSGTPETQHLEAIYARIATSMRSMTSTPLAPSSTLPAYAAFSISGRFEIAIMTVINMAVSACFTWIAFASFRIYRIAKKMEKNGTRRAIKSRTQKAIGRIILCHTIVPLSHGGKKRPKC